jgi:hypothetical protein
LIIEGIWVGDINVNEGCFVGINVVGSNVSPRRVGTCVVGANEGEIVVGNFDGKFVGPNVVGI